VDVFEAVFKRRSVRSFKKAPVTAGQIERLLDAARWAPSAGNLQPWVFVVVTAARTREALAAAAYGQGFLAEAPVVIAVATKPPARTPYGERGAQLYCLQDTAAAVENILLAAHALGLGACWVGAFDDGAVAQALELGPDERPVALVPVGEPARVGKSDRKSLADVVRYIR